MNLIKIKFLKNGQPQGRAYTYYSDNPVQVDDLVQLPHDAKGIVTEINVSEEEVADFRDKVKKITGKIEISARLKNWSVLNVVKSEFQAPELGVKYLQGNVYGSPKFEDGSFINSSPIDTVLSQNDHKEIITRTGSRYLVYPDDVLPEAEKSYPGYYDRLKATK